MSCNCAVGGYLVEIDPLDPVNAACARVARLQQEIGHEFILNGQIELLEHRELGKSDVCPVEASAIRTEWIRGSEGAELGIDDGVHLHWGRESVQWTQAGLRVRDRHVDISEIQERNREISSLIVLFPLAVKDSPTAADDELRCGLVGKTKSRCEVLVVPFHNGSGVTRSTRRDDNPATACARVSVGVKHAADIAGLHGLCKQIVAEP